jgi:ABC-type branched-subunit amino acid transport system ATPase component
MSLLEVKDLHAGYGRLPVLHGVSLRVDPGEIVALIGPNGAGKSTFTKALSRQLPIQRGSLELGGRDITRRTSHELSKEGLACVPQAGNVFGNLTVEENLRISVCALTKAERSETREHLYRLFPRLEERRRARARTLSGGERQMLAVASAMALRPRLLVLDEPTSGMAPLVIESLVERIVQYRVGGASILWVIGESAKQIVEHVDRAYVLQSGQIVDHLTGEQIGTEGAMAEAFLGTSVGHAARPPGADVEARTGRTRRKGGQ